MVNLQAQYKRLEGEVSEKWKQLCRKGSFILGEEVEKFEEEFAVYCARKHAVAVSSGTSALHLALEASGVRGREVITTPFTFIATAEAVIHAGGKIKWIDIEKRTYCLDAEELEKNISPETAAVMPVQLYGCSADMDPILESSRKAGLAVIEDCAQSHGALYKGRKSGSLGDIACFSFYPGKNLGAYGDAGCVVCDSDETAQLLRRLGNHGSDKRYYHTEVGYNYRMDTLQAAVLRIKLRYLDTWNEKRRRIAGLYNERLKGLPLALPEVPEYAEHVFHQYVILADDREKLMKKLADSGIATAIHYPVALHMQPSFSDSGYSEGDFPVSEEISRRCLSLPICPELSESQVEYITGKIREFYG